MAGVYTLKINQGETYRQTFQWLQGGGDTPRDGKPVNLHGYAGKCQIRSNAQNSGVIVTIPVTIFNPEEGRFSLDLTAEKTTAIPTNGAVFSEISKYVYDIELISSGGTVYRILNGVAEISPEVTR